MARRALPLRGVIFDMDGTLTVPNLDFAELYRRAGVPRGDDILSDKWRNDPKACAVVREFEAEGRATMRLMPGARELGTWLRAHGARAAIVTRNSGAALTHFTDCVWNGTLRFSPAVSRDDPYPPKPDPASARAIADEWGEELGPSLLMVGDSPANDIVFGFNAGLTTALLEAPEPKPRPVQPDLVAPHLAALAGLIWSHFTIESPLTAPSLHEKRQPPTPAGDAATAAAAGNVAALRALDRRELGAADPETGQTPLVWAADAGSSEAVQFLLDAGVDANASGFL